MIRDMVEEFVIQKEFWVYYAFYKNLSLALAEIEYFLRNSFII